MSNSGLVFDRQNFQPASQQVLNDVVLFVIACGPPSEATLVKWFNTVPSRRSMKSASRRAVSWSMCSTFQLAVNPHRITIVLYGRFVLSRQWKQRPLDWAMERIAERAG